MIIVGKNNAGKSTVVEALRLISIVTNRYKHLTVSPPPAWLDMPGRLYGVSPSLRDLEINFQTIYNNYGLPPVEITAIFSNKCSITIYIAGEEKIHAVIRDSDNNIIKDRKQAHSLGMPIVNIMPQVAPLQKQEKILTEDYVKSTMSSYLAPLHFRNQLNIFYNEYFKRFQQLVQKTWPNVQVKELLGQGGLPHDNLDLEIRNEGFVAEVACMGHGLQMWLQTMWFLTYSESATTIILDEPDVYMHADLQRRIIRFLKGQFDQVIITTHSIEIMSEVEPNNILVVDKDRPKSVFLNTIPGVQHLIDSIGSAHNIHLSRLWNSRKFIFIEGKDLNILKKFQEKIFPQTPTPFDIIPNMSVGGWGGWNYSVGTNKFLRNSLGEKILAYCIYDSDYHTDEEISCRYSDAAKRDIQLHI